MFDALHSSLKAAAIGGILFAWASFTKEALKLSWHIITTSPEKDTYKAVSKVRCQNCKEFFIGDEEDEICLSCLGEFTTPLKKRSINIPTCLFLQGL